MRGCAGAIASDVPGLSYFGRWRFSRALAAVSLCGFLFGRRTAAFQKPDFKIGFEDTDPALRDLHLGGAGSFREQAFERAADDTRSICGLVKAEDLHVCDLVVLGRLVFLARRTTSYARSMLPA